MKFIQNVWIYPIYVWSYGEKKMFFIALIRSLAQWKIYADRKWNMNKITILKIAQDELKSRLTCWGKEIEWIFSSVLWRRNARKAVKYLYLNLNAFKMDIFTQTKTKIREECNVWKNAIVITHWTTGL